MSGSASWVFTIVLASSHASAPNSKQRRRNQAPLKVIGWNAGLTHSWSDTHPPEWSWMTISSSWWEWWGWGFREDTQGMVREGGQLFGEGGLVHRVYHVTNSKWQTTWNACGKCVMGDLCCRGVSTPHLLMRRLRLLLPGRLGGCRICHFLFFVDPVPPVLLAALFQQGHSDTNAQILLNHYPVKGSASKTSKAIMLRFHQGHVYSHSPSMKILWS